MCNSVFLRSYIKDNYFLTYLNNDILNFKIEITTGCVKLFRIHLFVFPHYILVLFKPMLLILLVIYIDNCEISSVL